MRRVTIVGPVYPYRAGIAYCTTRLAEELARSCEVTIVSFRRQYPQRFYPGGSDIDESLRERTPAGAEFSLDILNPLTWLSAGWRIRRSRPDAVILVWWIWVWALPYLTILRLLPRGTNVILQCHNISDKEPARWKTALTNLVLRRGRALVVHARIEMEQALRRSRGRRVLKTHLPVHELGGAIPPREHAKASLHLAGRDIALFFGHVRPFKALDVVLRAWPKLHTDAVLLVAGEAWWESAKEYRALAAELGLRTADAGAVTPEAQVVFDFRFIPDAEIATYFAAADVVLAPYRTEAQSGVALTAFHFARPVIGSWVGGLPEIITDGANGYLVPPEDPAALASAIDRFFEMADRPSLERGAAAAAARCSWDAYARVFESLATPSKDYQTLYPS